MRCYVPPPDWSDGPIVLGGAEAHHLLHVLRLRQGQQVELFDGQGRHGVARIDEARGSRVQVTLEQQELSPRLPVYICLTQALAREPKMDLVLQKAVELGASAVVPVSAEHAVVRLKEAQVQAKHDRWQKIVLNAAKQCKADWLPAVTPLRTVDEALDQLVEPCGALLCSLRPDARPIREVLTRARAEGLSRFYLFVGPEGDFSEAEAERIQDAGGVAVSLGPGVLRTETAALYALSIMRYEFLG